MILSRKDIQVDLWDARVASLDSYDAIFMYSWYLDAVFPEWQAYVLDDYRAIFPLTPVKKMGFMVSIQPFLTRSFTPIGFTSEEEEQLFKSILKNTYVQMGLTKSTLETKKRVHQIIDQNKNGRMDYSENHKRQCAKFEKLNLEISEKFLPERLIDLFKQVKGDELKHLGLDAYNKLLNLMIKANGMGALVQFSIFADGILVGSSAYILINRRMLYLKGIVLPEYQKKGGMVYLHHLALSKLSENFDTFDFGGSNDEGLGNFNRKFGAQDEEYLLLTSNRLPWPINSWVKSKWG